MSTAVTERPGEGAVGVLGTRMLRREDPALLSGESQFIHDLAVPGALHLSVVRSPHAHARVLEVDLSAALGCPGVLAFSGRDLLGEWAAPMPCAWPVTADMQSPTHHPVAVDEACYVGDAVAVVLAESAAEAQDAAALVGVTYEALPAAVDLADAASDRVLAHETSETNRAYTWELIPDAAAVERAFAEAVVTVSERYVQQRLIPAAMEPRGVCVVPQPFGGGFTVYSSTQIPHILRTMLGITAGVPEGRLRVVAPAVGGGFGSKLNVYAEELLCLALARRLRRPVRWSEERSEAPQATIQGRGQIQEIELAADAEGIVRAVRVRLVADMGAYLQLVTPGIPLLGAFLYHGVYDVP
ncbi:MAG: xanthine dehydrogenase family protein molybdopterin-binding subunit, partial [Acidimicrobiales bacterium]